MFPNFENATINGKPLTEVINDEKYLKNDFCSRVAKRGSEVLHAKGFSSVFPAGKALCDHLHDWYHGSSETVSMGVYSNGARYNIPAGIYFSMPVHCTGGFGYEVDTSVQLTEYGISKLKTTT